LILGLSTKLNDAINRIIKKAGINNRTALFAAGEARRLMNDFVPMNTGALCDKTRVFTENGRGCIIYTQPYAAFCYYGDKKNFSRDKHEKASAYWDKAMLTARKGELTKSVDVFVRRG